MPFIIDAVTIDGRTQPGFAGTPIITVRNTTVFPPLLGFRIARPGPSTIRSLVIVGFNTGISIRSDGATIVGNYVSSGAVPGGNFQGIQVEETSVGVIIGGPAPGDGNVITANERGITLTGPHGTTIQGNIIGLDPSGTAVGNGIGIFGGGTNTTIGGPLPGQGNVISGNARGVELIGAVGTTIQGNFIGTDITGSTAIPNDRALELYGVRTTIIGGTGSARNVISGNRLFGIALGQACTDIDTCTTPEDVVIAGNLIGTDHTGTQPLGNASHGILIGTAPDVIIGGTGAGEGNTIRFNGGIGIFSGNTVDAEGSSQRFLGNSIDLNGGLGIDIGGNGVTPNDHLDADPGRQNFPSLTSASVTSSTLVTGTLHSTPARTFRIEFFSSPAADPSGFGEGGLFLGFTTVTTGADGNAIIAATLPKVAQGSFITSTATAVTSRSTSEFSNAVAAGLSPTVNVSDTTVTEGDSGTTAAVFTISLTTPSAGDVTFQFATTDGTATAPNDYTATTGMGTIPAGSLSTTISVPVLGDTLNEPDETFFVNITNVVGAAGDDLEGEATIATDEMASVNVSDVTVTEGDSGTTAAVFTVSLTAPSGADVTFQFATVDGTAMAPGDYTATTGMGTIPAGSLSAIISVPVLGDTIIEPDETFIVNITDVAGAAGGDLEGEATIANDDAPSDTAAVPTLSEWALMLMALFLAIAGATAMRA